MNAYDMQKEGFIYFTLPFPRFLFSPLFFGRAFFSPGLNRGTPRLACNGSRECTGQNPKSAIVSRRWGVLPVAPILP